jgi:uncharacterized Zn-finger protein
MLGGSAAKPFLAKPLCDRIRNRARNRIKIEMDEIAHGGGTVESLLVSAMADDGYAKFSNDSGVPEIRIGVKEFKCIGASPPNDHPHIYLDMSNNETILCPYCATLFRFDLELGPHEADPPDCLYLDDADG